MNIQDVEAALCGMAMREPSVLADAVAKGVTRGHFVSSIHGEVFDVLRDIWSRGQVTDLVTVVNGVGREHASMLALLRSEAPLTQNHEPYIDALLDAKRQDALQEKLVDIGRSLTGRKVLEPLGPIVDRLAEVMSVCKGSETVLRTDEVKTVLDRSLAAAEERIIASRDGQAAGIPTGFAPLDRLVYGFQPGFMYVLGARTSVGKTTMAVNMALAAALAGHKAAFVTVEMSGSDIADKMLTRLSRVDIGRYLSGDMAEEEIDRIMRGAKEMASLPLVFTEVLEPSLQHLSFEIFRLVKTQGVKLVIVDYLQLFELGDERRVQRTSREEAKAVSAKMKALAKRLGVPILVLSQLNRQAPEAGEPELIHIAESDQIARDADVILFLYRDEYGDYYMSIGKNRRGMKVTFPLRAELQFSLFADGDDSPGRKMR